MSMFCKIKFKNKAILEEFDKIIKNCGIQHMKKCTTQVLRNYQSPEACGDSCTGWQTLVASHWVWELRIGLKVIHIEKSAHTCVQFFYIAVHGERTIKKGMFSIMFYLRSFSSMLLPLLRCFEAKQDITEDYRHQDAIRC